ncbi:MAG TPA: hypothetical protein VGF97_05175 [Rhizomicrobium sp.]
MSETTAPEWATCAAPPRMARNNFYVFKRLLQRGKLEKVFVERLTEPLHLNLLSLFVALFGSYRTRVAWDLVVRQQYAFPILFAAEAAKSQNLKQITVVEFGVAGGAGLLNMCRIAARTQAATGVAIRVVGFDTGKGMPPAIDYRDLPEHFQQGDFPMDFSKLRAALPAFAELVIGDVQETVPAFLKTLSADAPLGFVAVDVDYYSSAKACLGVLAGNPDSYLPLVPVYLDDIGVNGSNPWTGELLAVNEFNAENDMRKIAPFTLLRSRRIFKNTQWIDRMFAAHIHDHSLRSPLARRAHRRVLDNEYLGQTDLTQSAS